MNLKKLMLGLAMVFCSVNAVEARQIFDTQPPAVVRSVGSELSGVWVPVYPSQLPPGMFGLSATIISGKYFVSSQWGLPDTCGTYLGLKATVPKSTPNTTIAGEREVFEPTGQINYGTDFILMIPGKPGTAASVRFDSYDPGTDRLTATFSQNNYGFNGQVVLRRYLTVLYPSPAGCP